MLATSYGISKKLTVLHQLSIEHVITLLSSAKMSCSTTIRSANEYQNRLMNCSCFARLTRIILRNGIGNSNGLCSASANPLFNLLLRRFKMKLLFRLLTLFVLSCCAFFVFTFPPQPAVASDTCGNLSGCAFCDCQYNSCVSRCAGDTACIGGCASTYQNFCATPDCTGGPRKAPRGRPGGE